MTEAELDAKLDRLRCLRASTKAIMGNHLQLLDAAAQDLREIDARLNALLDLRKHVV